jgi:hypothetical protein
MIISLAANNKPTNTPKPQYTRLYKIDGFDKWTSIWNDVRPLHHIPDGWAG